MTRDVSSGAGSTSTSAPSPTTSACCAGRSRPPAVVAVVKADGYGHGAVPVAAAALDAGAAALAVAIVAEGVELRDAGIDGRILVLSEPRADELPECVAFGLEPARVHDRRRRRRGEGGGRPRPRRRRCTSRSTPACTESAPRQPTRSRLAEAVTTGAVAVARVDLDALRRGRRARRPVHRRAAGPLRRRPRRRRRPRASTSRGATPPTPPARSATPLLATTSSAPASPPTASLRRRGCRGATASTTFAPRSSWKARVSFVKTVAAGERISYGLRHRFERDTVVATVPVGYADGVPRRLELADVGGEVLIGGRRRPDRRRRHDGPAHGRLRPSRRQRRSGSRRRR